MLELRFAILRLAILRCSMQSGLHEPGVTACAHSHLVFYPDVREPVCAMESIQSLTLWLDQDKGAGAAHCLRIACDEEGTKMVRVDEGAGELRLAPDRNTSIASCVRLWSES